jgi:hypothetical protein
MTTLSPAGTRVKAFSYQGFQGIDLSRDKSALDTGEQQHLLQLRDGYADWRGMIVLDPGVKPRVQGIGYVKHVTFFGNDLVAWAQKDGGGTSLITERGHRLEEVFPRDAPVSSTIFNNRAVFMCRDEIMRQYDGQVFRSIEPPFMPRPAFGVVIQRRLAIAGMSSNRTLIDISRVDRENVFARNEDPGSADVTKAGDIDVVNIIGTADEITGLGVFETDRLAVFTNDQTLIYVISPDITAWQLDERANINVGCISHNTIASANSDLYFCSRDGVHSIRRSQVNGISILSMPMSSKVRSLYRQYVRSVENPELISASFDHDLQQYHVFFPVTEQIAHRLTLTLTPMRDAEASWSTGAYLNATCMAHLGGKVLLGTPGGIWERLDQEDSGEFVPEMVVTTPILWQGSINEIKEASSFIMQAVGSGTIQVEALDERGRELSTLQLLVDDTASDDNFPDVPLSRQYERRFEHRYRGVQFRFTSKGSGPLKIIGFAVTVRT